jgi:hypothetical protein
VVFKSSGCHTISFCSELLGGVYSAANVVWQIHKGVQSAVRTPYQIAYLIVSAACSIAFTMLW